MICSELYVDVSLKARRVDLDDSVSRRSDIGIWYHLHTGQISEAHKNDLPPHLFVEHRTSQSFCFAERYQAGRELDPIRKFR